MAAPSMRRRAELELSNAHATGGGSRSCRTRAPRPELELSDVRHGCRAVTVRRAPEQGTGRVRRALKPLQPYGPELEARHCLSLKGAWKNELLRVVC